MPTAARPMTAGMIQRVEVAAVVVASCGRPMAGQPVRAAPLVAVRVKVCPRGRGGMRGVGLWRIHMRPLRSGIPKSRADVAARGGPDASAISHDGGCTGSMAPGGRLGALTPGLQSKRLKHFLRRLSVK